jgi:hypothetical protein
VILNLNIQRASASWRENELHVSFDVTQQGHDHLDLKTGEIFQNSKYAASRAQKDKAISATLFVTRRETSASGAELPSAMIYHPGHEGTLGHEGSASLISLIWRLPDDHLAAFHSLILAGKTPRGATVNFPFDPFDKSGGAAGGLEFGWEPDGSGQKWDNEKQRSVPIKNVSFDFDLPVIPPDAPWDEAEDRALFSDAARVNAILIRKLSSIESLLAHQSWTLKLIAILIVVLGLVLSRLWH